MLLLLLRQGYDELIDLASTGDSMRVHQSVAALAAQDEGEAKEEDDPDDPYRQLRTKGSERMIGFMFGHSVFQDIGEYKCVISMRKKIALTSFI